MEITFDPVKNERNVRERGLSFERAADFDFETALYRQDNRKDYGEVRWQALGHLDGKLHTLVFTYRDSALRIISFRRANKKEVKRYVQSKS